MTNIPPEVSKYFSEIGKKSSTKFDSNRAKLAQQKSVEARKRNKAAKDGQPQQ